MWVQLVWCLRQTDMPLSEIRRYEELCKLGDGTIPERHEMMVKQKVKIENEIEMMKKRLKIVKYKVQFYQDLIDGKTPDESCNPMKVMSEQARKECGL